MKLRISLLAFFLDLALRRIGGSENEFFAFTGKFQHVTKYQFACHVEHPDRLDFRKYYGWRCSNFYHQRF
ncbi:MAG: hypothetical protein EB119_10820 [Synechococcaceae bacterium WBB_34_004]|nr:hypothetical protein [Synechococcaceae bacterium WBB_34_004]